MFVVSPESALSDPRGSFNHPMGILSTKPDCVVQLAVPWRDPVQRCECVAASEVGLLLPRREGLCVPG